MTNQVITKEQVIESAWKRGYLKYKLKKHQVPIYQAAWNAIDNNNSTYVINCARRFGKTYTLILVAIEFGLRNPNSQIKYAIPIGREYIDMIMPSVVDILKDMPTPPQKQMKPFQAKQYVAPLLVEHKVSEKRLVFANGSLIKFAGTNDDKGVGLRGNTSNLNIIDEAGFVDELDNLYKTILFPQVMTTGGSTIFCSTPSDSADHDYETIYREHMELGKAVEFTIYDNTSFTQEMIDKVIEECGGEETTVFKREWLVQFVTESSLAIISEWTKKHVETNQLIREYPKDPYFNYYHKYISLDSGVKDITGTLYAHYNFQDAKLIIENESAMNGPDMTTEKLAAQIKTTMKETWGDNAQVKRYVADSNNLHLIQDLAISYKLPFVGVTKTTLLTVSGKDNVEPGMVNKVKVMIGQGRIVIHPRCEQLIGCLYNGVWAKNRRGEQFARSKKYGHYDMLASLIYLVISIDQNTNPIPILHGTQRETHFITKEQLERSNTEKQVWGKLTKI